MNNAFAAPAGVMDDVRFTADGYVPKLFDLNGRIGRVRFIGYGSTLLACALGAAAAGALLARSSTPLGLAVTVAGALFALACSVLLARRRLHDLDLPGWAVAFLFIPLVGELIALWLMIGAGSEQANHYGPPPTAHSAGTTVAAWCLLLVLPLAVLASLTLPAYYSVLEATQAVAGG